MTTVRQARLEDVVVTPQLYTRVPREADYKSESEAFRQLAASLANGPEAVFDALVSTALRLSRAGSAGVNLLTDDEDGLPAFRIVGAAGGLASRVGLTIPRDLSPSGVCLDRGSPLLLDHPERHFTHLNGTTPPIVESLLLPITTQDRHLGTLWLVSHDSDHRFDSEDVRLLESLAQIAAAIAMHGIALDQAEREVIRRNELFSIGSHELRNPLTTIIGFTSRLARRDDLPEEVQGEVNLVAREASRLRRILDDFFDLASLENAALKVNYDEVDLVELLHEQVAGFRIRHPAADVNEEFEAAPFVLSDASRVAQIVTNLLENAFKYGGEHPVITVRLRLDDLPRIDVEDRGTGIPPEAQERIFDRAYRLRQRDGETREGLGLGLYISRELAQRLGGSLTVKSERGRGSTFTLTLPPER